MSIFDIFKKKNKQKASTNGLRAVIRSLERREIVMETDEGVTDVPANASKLGGKPWLPLDFVWPVFTDDEVTRPLSFLCQINMADVKPYDSEGLLPEHGMLYFFYEYEACRWGFDPEDNGCARVFYFEDTERFVSTELPKELSEECTVPEMAVLFTARPSYPDYEELEMHGDCDCDWDDYDELLGEMGVDTETEHHKLLGYADIIQSEMLSDCERVSRGLYCGDPESYQSTSEAEAASIQRGAKDWMLLLQLSTLEKNDWEMMWGDCGMLYFYIRKHDLINKRFENAWFSLQCG